MTRLNRWEKCEVRLMMLADLHFGIIGWGYWGPKIARNLDGLPHALVTMVADQDAHRLAPLIVNQPWFQTTTQAEEVFRSDIYVVIIATAVNSRYQLAKP